MPDCLNHPGTPAKITCSVCGKPVCKKCIVSKQFCSAQCASAAIIAAESKGGTPPRKQPRSGSWVRPVAVLLILAMLGFCAYHYYKRNRKTVDTKINQVKSKGKTAINDGQKYLRKDSKNKESRESSQQ